jgi:hypothetical protein
MSKKLTGNQIRQDFIDFLLFEYDVVKHRHTAVKACTTESKSP